MPPITIVFVTTGLALWMIACQFLGIGAKAASEDGPEPGVTVGAAAFIAGIVDLVEAIYILAVRPDPLGVGAVVLAGLVAFYGLFFSMVGWALARGLDLRPVGNLAVAVAIVPLFWWKFFDGGWMFHSILIVWVVAFFAVAAAVYGKLHPKVLGVILLATSIYAFFVPPVLLALGHSIP